MAIQAAHVEVRNMPGSTPKWGSKFTLRNYIKYHTYKLCRHSDL